MKVELACCIALLACGRMDMNRDAAVDATPGCYIPACDGPRFCPLTSEDGAIPMCPRGDGCNACRCEESAGAEHLADANTGIGFICTPHCSLTDACLTCGKPGAPCSVGMQCCSGTQLVGQCHIDGDAGRCL